MRLHAPGCHGTECNRLWLWAGADSADGPGGCSAQSDRCCRHHPVVLAGALRHGSPFVVTTREPFVQRGERLQSQLGHDGKMVALDEGERHRWRKHLEFVGDVDVIDGGVGCGGWVGGWAMQFWSMDGWCDRLVYGWVVGWGFQKRFRN